ncbi:MAG: hypothetical protein J0I43_11030 [Microbacterium sp.]|uniref:hypothetical protein n=1 Tax=Microbacterium sp. TaxID=51671 RepID=UPI001ACB4C6F|nr:hypothetical protein [Microbacterium sp.]MBN9177888.1 hypothetical protein [Microbacterium sp.]
MSARILYAHFAAANHTAAADWLRTVREMAAGQGSQDIFWTAQTELARTQAAVSWRLVSENRREISRASVLHSDERAVAADVAQLLRRAHELQVHTSPAPRLRSTGWFVSHGTEIVMIGARRYEKRSTAESAALLAMRLVRELAETAAETAADGTGHEHPDATTPLLLQ